MLSFFCCCKKQPSTERSLLAPLIPPALELEEAALTPISEQSEHREFNELPAPPNSPYVSQFVQHEKSELLLIAILRAVRPTATIILYLELNSQVIWPLSQGKYDLASTNFCRIFNAQPKIFASYCEEYEILTENVYSSSNLP